MLRGVRSFFVGGRFLQRPILSTPLYRHNQPSLLVSTTASLPTSRSASHAHFSTTSPRFLQPLEWTPAQDAKLLKLRESGQSWEAVAKVLGRKRATCHSRYHLHLQFKQFDFWTPKRNRRLRTLALQPVPWDVVAKEIQSMQEGSGSDGQRSHGFVISPIGCQHQWRVLLGGTTGRDGFKQPLPLKDVAALHERLEVEKQTLHRKQQEKQQKRQSHTTIIDTDLDMSLVDWKKITNDIFRDRITPERAQTHYAIAIRKSHKWTNAQVEKLPQFVAAHTSPTEGLTLESWDRIAADFNNEHTAKECRARWEALCRVDVGKKILGRSGNHWSKDEIRAYWRAWKQHGTDWNRIAEAVQSSSSSSTFVHVDEVSDKDKAMPTSTVSLAEKSAEDCRVDFKHVVTVSIPMIDELEREVGELALNLSRQPRKHWVWTTEQLITLEDAVRNITGGFQTLSQAVRNMTASDWETAAKQVDPKLTGDQCRYRWTRVYKVLPSLLTPDRKEPVPYPDKDTVYPSQRRRARLWTAEEVRGLEQAAESIRALPRIPMYFTQRAREELKLDRTVLEIRRKTNQILGRGPGLLAKATSSSSSGYSLAKAALSIFKVDPETIAARRHARILTGKRFRPDATGVDGEEEQIQIPSSTTINTTTPRETGIIGKPTPTLRFAWDQKNTITLTELLHKYGESTLSWKQVSAELSIPVSKCQDRWRYVKRVTAAADKSKNRRK